MTLATSPFKALVETFATPYPSVFLLPTVIDDAPLPATTGVEAILDGTHAEMAKVLAASVQASNENSSLEVFKTYNGLHPFLGLYCFDGRDVDSLGVGLNRGKRKLGVDIRIIGETYPYKEGDQLGAIGFGDGHVAVMKLGVNDSSASSFKHYATFTGNVLNTKGEVNDLLLQP